VVAKGPMEPQPSLRGQWIVHQNRDPFWEGHPVVSLRGRGVDFRLSKMGEPVEMRLFVASNTQGKQPSNFPW
jgi:hypothetical protein